MIEARKDTYSRQGKRCLALARKIIPGDVFPDDAQQPGTQAYEDFMETQAREGLILVGLVAIVDPLRPDIRPSVETLRGAGVRVFMVRVTP